MFTRFHDWIIVQANQRNAVMIFVLLTFIESFVSPVPPDIMMIPMIAANAGYLWYLPWVGALSSVLGGIIGYAIGFYFYQMFGESILHIYNMKHAFVAFQKTFNSYGFLMISLKGLTPIPFKLVAIAAGLAKFDFISFILASCIGRFSRFYIVAGLIWLIGPRFSDLLKRFFPLFMVIAIAGILLGIGIVKIFN